MTNFYFPRLIQETGPTEKKAIAKRSEFLLTGTDKIVILSFMSLSMDLKMMSDKKGELCLV